MIIAIDVCLNDLKDFNYFLVQQLHINSFYKLLMVYSLNYIGYKFY